MLIVRARKLYVLAFKTNPALFYLCLILPVSLCSYYVMFCQYIYHVLRVCMNS